MNVYAINGRFGAYVQLGEKPEKGVKEKPKRSSLTGGLTESTVTLDEGLKLLELPRELGHASGVGAADRRRPRPVWPVREAWRRLPIARSDRRSVHGRSRARARAARGAEALRASGGEACHSQDRGARRRQRPAGPRRTVRPVRHRRDDERVDSAGHRPGDDFAGRLASAPRGARRGTAPSRPPGRGSARRVPRGARTRKVSAAAADTTPAAAKRKAPRRKRAAP